MPSPDSPSLPLLPKRASAGHKGTFGTVAVLGGCCAGDVRMIGAPALAALAALRSGCGLVRLAMPAPIINAGISLAPSATGTPLPTDANGAIIAHGAAEVIDELILRSTCLLIGPGMGKGEGPAAASLRAAQQEDIPVVIDADALNRLAEVVDLHRDFRARAVLTPHPGEYARLAASLRISISPTDPATRPRAAEALASRLGCVVVLKGAGTVVSDGLRTWVCTRGHSCLATAGTGDVLGGVIAGIIAQFAHGVGTPLGLFEAAQIGVEAHALAAEAWARSHGAGAGMLAQELAEEIPGALEGLRAS